MTEELGLHNLRPNPGSTKATKRLGRGKGSGQGKTAGKGHKGYNARSGGGVRPGYEGGQMPLYMRLGKLRGPHMKKSMPIGPFRTYAVPVNVGRLAQRVRGRRRGHPGGARRQGHRQEHPHARSRSSAAASSRWRSPCASTMYSRSAVEKIEAAGGKAELL